MRTTPLLPLAVTTILALAVAGCGNSVEVVEGQTEHTGQPIFGGSPATAPEHAAVVSLHNRVGNQVSVGIFCSGTLISPAVVLTAAHCLDVARGGKPKFQTRSPDSLVVYVGDEPAVDLLDHLYIPTETSIHPSYNRVALRNDIGVIRLGSAVVEAAPVPHLPSSLGFTAADLGTNLNFAGFGQTETGQIGVKLQVDLPLGGLGCTVTGCPTSGDQATQISYAQSDAGPCSGDSGGPAFIDRGGAPYVGGLTSYGDAYCTIYGVSTRADAFAAWLDAFISGPDCSADGQCNDQCAPGDDPDCASGEGGSGAGGGGACAPVGAGCSADAQCCTGKCKGRGGAKTCKG